MSVLHENWGVCLAIASLLLTPFWVWFGTWLAKRGQEKTAMCDLTAPKSYKEIEFHEKRWTKADLLKMPREQQDLTMQLFKTGAFHLLGIPTYKKITWFEEPLTGDIVVQWI